MLPKIAYLSSEYPGISHTFILREILALRKSGIEVEAASIRKPAHLAAMTSMEQEEAAGAFYIKSAGIRRFARAHGSLLRRSPGGFLRMAGRTLSLMLRGLSRPLKGAAYLAEAVVLEEWMRERGIEHVHVHFANPAATVALVASACGEVSFSVSVHGPDVFYNVDGNVLAEKVKRASFVRCISHYCRSQLMRLVPYEFWTRLHIVRCGVDPTVFLPRPLPANETPEILCVGRLTPSKGQHVLLEACALLESRGVPFHLTLVGGGEDEDSVESLAEKLGLGRKVEFTGPVGQEKVHECYDRADVFVLPSFAEGVPVVLMEAMAKEIPCVATRITGIPELIEDGADGILVPPSDEDALARALEGLLADASLREKLGKRGREKVLNRYNLDDNCRLMGDLLRCRLLKEAK